MKKVTSLAMMAMLSLGTAWAQNGQFDPYFTTLPTEVGKGVVTSLNYNGQWTAIKGVAGSTLGGTSWGKYNNPWGGNGRVWIKCVADGQYVMAGQGRWLTGFDADDRSVTSEQGADESSALRFRIIKDEESEAPLYHFQSLDGQYWYRLEMTGDGNARNTLYRTPTTDDEGKPVADEYAWQIGTWKGVGFVRLDVKTWNDDPTGTNITKCEDGYYYSTMCYPYDLQIPDGNQFADGTAVPEMTQGDKLVTAWALAGEAQDITVTELHPGDIVKGGTCLMVRSTNQNVDLLIAPGSEYVAHPSEESLFTGYYCEAPLDENFYMSIQDGYPKFARGIIKDDVNFPDDPAATRQVAANLGFITSNRANRNYVEYRFDFENMTLQGYENPDYQRIAQVKFSKWLQPENVGGPFQIDPAKVYELQALLDAFIGDKTEEEYNALAAQFLSNVVRPELAFTAIKNVGGQYMGDRNQSDGQVGLYANFGTPNGANGRAYLKKVDDTHYQLGFNGYYVQAPVPGEQVEKAEYPVDFEVIVTEPGKVAFVKDGVALSKNTTLNGAALNRNEETGEYIFGNAVLWTIDTGYSDFIRSDANVQFDGMRYGTVCAPYALMADKEADPDATLYTILYNNDDDLVLSEVNKLEPGQPGVIMGANSPVKLTIVGTDFVSHPIAPTGDYALNGVISVLPEEGLYQNPHTLGVITTTEIVGEDEDAQYVTSTKLGLVMGNYDINQAFWEGGANADDVPLVMPDVKWDRQAEKELGKFLADNNVGGAFQIPADKVDEFKLKIAQVGNENDFYALRSEMIKSVTKPETFYGALKNTQFMGDRNQTDVSGLYTNFNTPNGANGRAYLKKVDDTHYQLGFNGMYVQAPVAGEQATKGTDPVNFDLTVVEPGKIAFSVDGVYLVAATTLQGGSLGATAEWTIDNSYTNIIRADAKYTAGDLKFGAITLPYAVKVDTEADKAAALYTVSYNGETLDMTYVSELPAGTPAIVSGSNTPVLLQIVGGYVSEPVAPSEGQALNGILSVNPGDNDFANPLFINVNSAGELVMDQMNWYDINQAFFNCPDIMATEVKFAKVPTQADNEANGISDLTIVKNIKPDAVYNLSGQKVSGSFRGIVIVGGKKTIR